MKGHVMKVLMQDGSKLEVSHIYPKLQEGLVLHRDSDAFPILKDMIDNGYGDTVLPVNARTNHMERATIRKLYQTLWNKRYEYVTLS